MTQPVNHALDPSWRLAYEASPADMLTWSKQYPFGNTATFNQELETYLPGNVSTQNGELILEGRNTGGGVSNVGGGKYTSGMVASYNVLSFLYGYVEASIKMPAGYGVWPAFWMLYTSVAQNNEIDICEIFESGTSLNSGVHFPGGTTHDGGATTVADMSAGYHAYAVDWQPTYVQFYFDGQPLNRITTPSEIPSQLMYILLNVAIGGVAVNNHVPADSQFPLDMHIQYVRIWQETSSQYQLVRSVAPHYANYRAAVLLDGASAYYPLSEASGLVAHDITPNANNATITGVTLGQSAILGDGSRSMLFDGATNYVALPTTVNPAGLYAFSAEIWFSYPTTHHGGRILSNAHTDQNNTGFQLSIDGTNGGLASLATANKTANLYWSTAFAPNTPYHLCMTYDGAHIYLYCNGVQVGNDTLTGAIVASAFPINIGRGSYNNDYWQGRAGHAAIYPIALSAAQVLAHYNAGIATPTGPATLTLLDGPVANMSGSDTAGGD